MWTLDKKGLIAVCTMTGIATFLFMVTGFGIQPENFPMFLFVSVFGTAFLTLVMINVSSTDNYRNMTNFGKLVMEHGTPRGALSHLASELSQLFVEENQLNRVKNLSKEQRIRKAEVKDKISDLKRNITSYTAVAKEWGMDVPDQWEWASWILPEAAETDVLVISA